MEITFLVGNGFDLGCGLKTKYIDFYEYIENNYNTLVINEKYKDNFPLKSNIIVNAIREDENVYNNWSDFEKALGNFTENINVDEEKENALFYKSLSQFKDIFCDYIKKENNLLNDASYKKIGENIKELLSDLTCNCNANNKQTYTNMITSRGYTTSAITYNFISFNYTDVLKESLNTIKDSLQHTGKDNKSYKDKIGEIQRIHGTVDDRMLIGVNDESQIKNKELLSLDEKYKDILIKPHMNDIINKNLNVSCDNLINSAKIVCTYGLSLGETDKMWVNKISNLLARRNDVILIVFNQKSDIKLNGIHPENYFLEIRNIQEMIESYRTCRKTATVSIPDRIFIDFECNKINSIVPILKEV